MFFIYSFMTPHLPWVADEIRHLRSGAGATPLLAAGGSHVSGEPELAMACGFNVIFRGPGERTFLQFGRDLLAGKIVAGETMIYDGRTLPDDGERKKIRVLGTLHSGFQLY